MLFAVHHQPSPLPRQRAAPPSTYPSVALSSPPPPSLARSQAPARSRPCISRATRCPSPTAAAARSLRTRAQRASRRRIRAVARRICAACACMSGSRSGSGTRVLPYLWRVESVGKKGRREREAQRGVPDTARLAKPTGPVVRRQGLRSGTFFFFKVGQRYTRWSSHMAFRFTSAANGNADGI